MCCGVVLEVDLAGHSSAPPTEIRVGEEERAFSVARSSPVAFRRDGKQLAVVEAEVPLPSSLVPAASSQGEEGRVPPEKTPVPSPEEAALEQWFTESAYASGVPNLEGFDLRSSLGRAAFHQAMAHLYTSRVNLLSLGSLDHGELPRLRSENEVLRKNYEEATASARRSEEAQGKAEIALESSRKSLGEAEVRLRENRAALRRSDEEIVSLKARLCDLGDKCGGVAEECNTARLDLQVEIRRREHLERRLKQAEEGSAREAEERATVERGLQEKIFHVERRAAAHEAEVMNRHFATAAYKKTVVDYGRTRYLEGYFLLEAFLAKMKFDLSLLDGVRPFEFTEEGVANLPDVDTLPFSPAILNLADIASDAGPSTAAMSPEEDPSREGGDDGGAVADIRIFLKPGEEEARN